MHRRALGNQSELLTQLRPVVQQVQIRDRLVGTPLPDLMLLDEAGYPAVLSEHGRDAVVWFVAPESCVRCLDGLQEWNALAASSDLATLLVLTGVSRVEGMRIVRGAGIRGRVFVDPNARSDQALGLTLPSTHLLVDAQGVIRMADSRQTPSSCSWSFPAQVAAFRDRGVPHVRSVPDPRAAETFSLSHRR